MTIGAALFLIAVGAILRFAITISSTHGIAVHTVGIILMIVGVLGLALWCFIWAPWARRRRTTYVERPPLDEEHHTRSTYRTDRHYYEDEYPR